VCEWMHSERESVFKCVCEHHSVNWREAIFGSFLSYMCVCMYVRERERERERESVCVCNLMKSSSENYTFGQPSTRSHATKKRFTLTLDHFKKHQLSLSISLSYLKTLTLSHLIVSWTSLKITIKKISWLSSKILPLPFWCSFYNSFFLSITDNWFYLISFL